VDETRGDGVKTYAPSACPCQAELLPNSAREPRYPSLRRLTKPKKDCGPGAERPEPNPRERALVSVYTGFLRAHVNELGNRRDPDLPGVAAA
jgi:hypothetical protein